MAMLIPNEGEIQLLTDLLGGGSLENWTLKLYSSNTTPAETDTAASYTECNFTGYSGTSGTLTRSIGAGTWSSPTSNSSNTVNSESADAKSTYGSSAKSYSATSAQTVYGYIIVGATSGKLIAAEKFGSSISLVNPSTLTLQPVMQLA